ncbi:MAG TPA: AbrB/MazE/SpoVT family DNA-binding domain-containing protein [Myxococcota bacterium]|nr:AbrB/MazE/SpoVT family DNA-binding domain-containing protein [Myxococcota bacterium]
MRVTSKGQVTIPIDIRQQLGIGPESEVEFEVVGGVAQLRKVLAPESAGRRVLGALRAASYSGPSTEALMALTRGEE